MLANSMPLLVVVLMDNQIKPPSKAGSIQKNPIMAILVFANAMADFS